MFENEVEGDRHLTPKGKKKTYKGKRKRPPQKIDPKNWEECEEDEFAELME